MPTQTLSAAAPFQDFFWPDVSLLNYTAFTLAMAF